MPSREKSGRLLIDMNGLMECRSNRNSASKQETQHPNRDKRERYTFEFTDKKRIKNVRQRLIHMKKKASIVERLTQRARWRHLRKDERHLEDMCDIKRYEKRE